MTEQDENKAGEMTFKDSLDVVRCDLRSRGQNLSFAVIAKDPIARFHLYLRLTEFLSTRSRSPLYYFIKWRFLVLSSRLGFSIPEHTLGKGVYLPHYGTIVVNSKSKVGAYSVLNVGVVIGRHPSSKEQVPIVGEGVYVGPGAKLFGAISVGDYSVIGANSVVTKDVPERQLWAGVTAKFVREISDQETELYIPHNNL